MNFRRIISATFAALLLAAMLALPASAKVVSPGKEFYFLDQANVLTEATEGEIFFSNRLLEDACGAQIVVAAINTTGAESIDDYAFDLFNDWGIGDAQRQNGFLLLLAIQDDGYYAVCGANLQSRLTSGTLDQYFEDYLETDFAAKRYDTGVKRFFEAVFARIADIYSANVTTAQGIAAYEAWLAEGRTTEMVATSRGGSRGAVAPARRESGMGIGMFLVILVLIIVLVALTSGRRRRRRGIFIVPPPPPRRSPFTPPPPPVGRGGHRGRTGGLFGLFGGGFSRPSSGTPFGGSRPSSGTPFGGSRPSSGTPFGGSRPSSGSPFGASRSSGSSGRSFGSAKGGGGGTRGGGAGRGRH